MNNINPRDIIDAKMVNNTTYYLVKCEENDIKTKLWIPEYLMIEKAEKLKNSPKKDVCVQLENPMKTLDDKINQIYRQLSKANETELLNEHKQIIRLHLNELPSSQRLKINSTIATIMQNYKASQKTCPTLMRKLRRSVLQEEVINRRRRQLSVLFCLEKELNLVAKCLKKITVENFVDFELLPFNFSYINGNIAGDDVSFLEHPPMGCDCIGRRICLLNKCCPEMFNSQATYNEASEVMIPPNMPIYECNRNCKCSKSCSNRVVQRGSNVKFVIYRKKSHNWGVRAAQFVKKGVFISEYVGEIVKRNKLNHLEQEEEKGHYFFDLNFNNEDCFYTLNSWKNGNISRFINHSCNPNLNVYSVWIDSSDPNIYHVALFSSRDIHDGEELTLSCKNQSIWCKCHLFCK